MDGAGGEGDTEGHILQKVRTELGYAGRLVLSLDLHANFTRRMLEYADAVTAYQTFPHMDFRATGERAARLALQPGPFRRSVAKIAALMPPADSTHFAGNLCDMLGRARQLEREEGVVDVCILPVQPWMDIDEMGTSVVVTATSAEGVPQAALEDLARAWYDQRIALEDRLSVGSTFLRRPPNTHNDGPLVPTHAGGVSGGGSGGPCSDSQRSAAAQQPPV